MRGREATHRFVAWSGAFPKIGEGIRYTSGRRYVITSITKPSRITKTLFRVRVVELGADDPDPTPTHPCVRDVKKGR